MTDDARLSRLLFEAREQLDMWGDIVQKRVDALPEPGRVTRNYPHDLRDQIDEYRAERGWNPHGYGGEDTPPR